MQIGYLRYVDDKPVDDDGNILLTQGDIEKNIHWQSEEAYKKQETWFYGLKRDSDYKLFARFIPTAAYDQSAISAPSDIIKTGHALFDKEKLMIQTVVKLGKAEETTRTSDIGAQIRITYAGEGYDEGKFSLQRSNGEEITLDQALVKTDAATETISYTYTYTKEDVGSYITVEYSAKEDALHYQGSITKTNSEVVTKKVNPDLPDEKYQKLERDLDTNLILTEVNDKYEYYLSDKETYVPEDSDYDTLSKKEDGSHEFTNLERMGEYYLWTRIAETDTYAASIPQTSEKISPTPFINFGDLMLENKTDKVSPPKTESKFIAFPDTLKKGTITIKENLIKTQVDESDSEAQAIEADIKHPVSEFVRGDGSASDLVYEKGSTWGDRNFAVELVFYDKDEEELQRVDGTKETVEVPEDTAFMKVVIYRVNAMHETAYTWEAMLEDASDEKITAKLKADITMTTQISIQLPQKIWLTLDEQVMRQSTNNEQAVNRSSMPMEFGIDRWVADKAQSVPHLQGQMLKTVYYDEIPDGEAYLKCANDGSNYTNIPNGAWLDSKRTTSDPAYLLRLGVDAWSGYYFSGITSKDQTWEFDDSGQIEAYKFNFIVEVAEEDTAIGGKYIYEDKHEEAAK